MLFLALKKIEMVKITPRQIPTFQRQDFPNSGKGWEGGGCGKVTGGRGIRNFS